MSYRSSLSLLLLLLLTPLFAEEEEEDYNYHLELEVDQIEHSRTALLYEIAETTDPLLRTRLSIEGGDYFSDLEQYDIALYFYQLALNESQQLTDHNLLGEVHLKRALVEEDLLAARILYYEAERHYHLAENDAQRALVLENLIWTYNPILDEERKIMISLLEQAIELRRPLPYSPRQPESLRILASFYEEQLNILKASELYMRAFELDLYALGFDDIRTMLAMERLAMFQIRYGHFKSAEELLRRKLELHQKSRYPDIYYIGRTQAMLGWIHLQNGKIEVAERSYLAALKNINRGITRDPNQTHTASLPVLFDLVYLYTLEERYEVAEYYFTLALNELDRIDAGDARQYLESLTLGYEGAEGTVFGGFPWSIEAQMSGVEKMLRYQDQRNNISQKGP